MSVGNQRKREGSLKVVERHEYIKKVKRGERRGQEGVKEGKTKGRSGETRDVKGESKVERGI